jgi:hypothetical protein
MHRMPEADPDGPRRTMSITKLKPVGSWPPRGKVRAVEEEPSHIRGRIITGLLTGDDPGEDERTVAPDPQAPDLR